MSLRPVFTDCGSFVFQDLVNNGAMVALANKFDETPLEKAKGRLAKLLSGKIGFSQ